MEPRKPRRRSPEPEPVPAPQVAVGTGDEAHTVLVTDDDGGDGGERTVMV